MVQTANLVNMVDVPELVQERRRIEREIRKVEREILKPFGGMCLTTTFPQAVGGTLEECSDEEIPPDKSKEDLRALVHENSEWQSLKAQLHDIQSKYAQFIKEQGIKESSTYKEEIVAIRKEYGRDITAWEISKLVGCSPDHARRFVTPLLSDGPVYERGREERLGQSLRNQILERDNHSCVRCQSEIGLEIHHITPVNKDGKSVPNNLATLCCICHRQAHGDHWGSTAYSGVEGFWEWVSEK